MPYIKEERREVLDPGIDWLVHRLDADPLRINHNLVPEGEVVYVLTKVVDALYSQYKKFAAFNKVLGIFEAAKLEFYRRRVAPYEDKKKLQNGDVYLDEE